MNLFDDDRQKFDDANLWVEEQPGTDNMGPMADDAADDVLEKSDEFSDKLPSDFDDPLVDPIQVLKGKVDS